MREYSQKSRDMTFIKGSLGDTPVTFLYGEHDGTYRLTDKSIDELFNNYCERHGIRIERAEYIVQQLALPHLQSPTDMDYDIYYRTKLFFAMNGCVSPRWIDRLNQCYRQAQKQLT